MKRKIVKTTKHTSRQAKLRSKKLEKIKPLLAKTDPDLGVRL